MQGPHLPAVLEQVVAHVISQEIVDPLFPRFLDHLLLIQERRLHVCFVAPRQTIPGNRSTVSTRAIGHAHTALHSHRQHNNHLQTNLVTATEPFHDVVVVPLWASSPLPASPTHSSSTETR